MGIGRCIRTLSFLRCVTTQSVDLPVNAISLMSLCVNQLCQVVVTSVIHKLWSEQNFY
jgi:hypothetical protein